MTDHSKQMYIFIVFYTQFVTHLVKVSCDAMKQDLITAATSTITHCVWMNVPVLSYPTLSMSVSVQLELLDTIVKMVSPESPLSVSNSI